MEYPKRLRFTSKYRNYQIFFVSPTKVIIDGELVKKPGKMLIFQNWECVCTDPDTIKLALEDGYYGNDYTCPEWEKIRMEEKQKGEQLKNEEDTVSVPKAKRSKKI